MVAGEIVTHQGLGRDRPRRRPQRSVQSAAAAVAQAPDFTAAVVDIVIPKIEKCLWLLPLLLLKAIYRVIVIGSIL